MTPEMVMDLAYKGMRMSMIVAAPVLFVTLFIGLLVSLFQAANNTAVMSDIQATRRGTVSGLLNLSRNLGLIFGASALGAVFARATPDVSHAAPQAVAAGLHATFDEVYGVFRNAAASLSLDEQRALFFTTANETYRLGMGEHHV